MDVLEGGELWGADPVGAAFGTGWWEAGLGGKEWMIAGVGAAEWGTNTAVGVGLIVVEAEW